MGKKPNAQGFLPLLGSFPASRFLPRSSIDTIVCAGGVRASVKCNTCPPMSEECPSPGPGPGSKGGRAGGEGTEAPGCPQVPPSPGLMCFPEDPGLLAASAHHAVVNGVEL